MDVDEARSQRLELKQVEEDLLQATREQARLLERLKAMNQIAEEARQSKQEFIAKVSHELRTPLNMIIAYSELITQSPKLYGGRIAPALLADIAVILRNSQHLSKLVDDVLDLSQIDAGRMALSKSWVDLTGDCGRVCRGRTSAVSNQRPLLGGGCPGEPAADLLRPYTHPAGADEPVEQRRALYCRGWGARADMGDRRPDWSSACRTVGLGSTRVPRSTCLNRFQQIDASIRRSHGGSGLGLNISKQFVEMHEGHIWLESQPGEGTKFHVSLPLAPAPVDDFAPPAARRWVHPYDTYVPRTRPRIAPVPEVKARYVVMETGHTLERLFTRYMGNVEAVRVQNITEALRVLSESPARAFVVSAALLPQHTWPERAMGEAAV